MIIVNQNKNEFVNFDNIMNVCVTDCDEDGFGIFAGFIVGRDDNYRGLGYYKTEERAKEVLKEITKRCMLSERFKALSISDAQREMIHEMYDKDEKLFIYEMPKE